MSTITALARSWSLKNREAVDLHGRGLLAVYLIAPVLFFVVALDIIFFHGTFGTLLPRTPNAILVYLLLFDLPHIIASFFSFADREYLRFYRKTLLWHLPILWGLTLAMVFWFPTLAMATMIVATLYHVVAQQAGIALFFAGRPPVLYTGWKIIAVTKAAFIYAFIYHPSSLIESLSLPIIVTVIGLFSILFFIISVKIFFAIPTISGRHYFAAMSGTFLLSTVLLALGYPLLSIFLVRFVHDITAFLIYANHDHNRNIQAGGANKLYKLFGNAVPIFLLTPMLAILLAFPITTTIYTTSLPAVFLIAFTHYFLESSIWKRNSIHRASLRIQAL